MKGKKNSKVFILVFLGMLTAFGPFVTDMYLSTLPAGYVGLFPYHFFHGSVRTYGKYDRACCRATAFRTVK